MRRALIPLLALTAILAACGDDEGSSTSEPADCEPSFTDDTAADTTSSSTTVSTPEDTSGDTTSTTEPVEVASSDIDDVEVSGSLDEEPTLEFPTAFAVEETTSVVVEEGDGEAITEGAAVTIDFLFVNGRTGDEITSSYEGEPAQIVMEESLITGVRQGLDCVTEGSRVLVAIAPGDGPGADPENGVEENDTVLFVADVQEVRFPLTRAEGEAVEPEEGLPTVELAEDGAPTITVPDEDPPEELVIQPLIEGDGPVVEAGQQITVHYTGVLWDTGEEFDSSWTRGTPATFEIGNGAVIPGWDEGLVGQTVGSQILLVIPPDKGYGEEGSGESIPPNSTLVFVVDILDAK